MGPIRHGVKFIPNPYQRIHLGEGCQEKRKVVSMQPPFLNNTKPGALNIKRILCKERGVRDKGLFPHIMSPKMHAEVCFEDLSESRSPLLNKGAP